MNNSTTLTSSRLPWLGTACCLLSAVSYTAANICMRQLAEIRADPAWVICLKESVAVLVVGPWLLWQMVRGVRPAFPARAMLVLFLASLAVQMIGNLGIQWSFGIVGLVISVPVVFGTLLLVSAVSGTILFRESIGVRSIAAVITVTVSIVLLSRGAASAAGGSTIESNLVLTWLAIAAACAGGATFAGLGVALRVAANNHIPLPVTIVFVTGTGSISLGILSLLRLGPSELLATDVNVLAWTTAAGLCNIVAFTLINHGIRLTTLVHANALNASQVALGALAGVFIFHEPHNSSLVLGVLVTVLGIILFGNPRREIAEIATSG